MARVKSSTRLPLVKGTQPPPPRVWLQSDFDMHLSSRLPSEQIEKRFGGTTPADPYLDSLPATCPLQAADPTANTSCKKAVCRRPV